MPIYAKEAEQLNKNGADAAIQAMRNSAQNRENDAALKRLILGHQQELESKQKSSDIASQAEETTNERNLAQLKNAQELGPEGATVHAANLSVGVDPMATMLKQQQKGNAQAIANTQKVYMSQVPKIQDAVTSSIEGLQSVNDPNNRMARGQAKTLLLKSYGMNRFNESEAKSLVPDSIYGKIANIGNSADNDATPLTQNEQAALNTSFMHTADMAKAKHDQLKANAIGSYVMSPYADPSKVMQMKQELGSKFEQDYQKNMDQFKSVPTNRGQSIGTPVEPRGLVDKLSDWYNGNNNQSAPAQPQQNSKPKTVTQGGHTYNLNEQTGNYE